MSTESSSFSPISDEHPLSSDENAPDGNNPDHFAARQQINLIGNDVASLLQKPGILDERNNHLPAAQADELQAAHANESNKQFKRKKKEPHRQENELKETKRRNSTLKYVIIICITFYIPWIICGTIYCRDIAQEFHTREERLKKEAKEEMENQRQVFQAIEDKLRKEYQRREENYLKNSKEEIEKQRQDMGILNKKAEEARQQCEQRTEEFQTKKDGVLMACQAKEEKLMKDFKDRLENQTQEFMAKEDKLKKEFQAKVDRLHKEFVGKLETQKEDFKKEEQKILKDFKEQSDSQKQDFQTREQKIIKDSKEQLENLKQEISNLNVKLEKYHELDKKVEGTWYEGKIQNLLLVCSFLLGLVIFRYNK